MKQIIPLFYVWNIVELSQAEEAEKAIYNPNSWHYGQTNPPYIFLINLNMAPTTFDEDHIKFLDICSCNNLSPEKYSMMVSSDARTWIRIE